MAGKTTSGEEGSVIAQYFIGIELFLACDECGQLIPQLDFGHHRTGIIAATGVHLHRLQYWKNRSLDQWVEFVQLT